MQNNQDIFLSRDLLYIPKHNHLIWKKSLISPLIWCQLHWIPFSSSQNMLKLMQCSENRTKNAAPETVNVRSNLRALDKGA